MQMYHNSRIVSIEYSLYLLRVPLALIRPSALSAFHWQAPENRLVVYKEEAGYILANPLLKQHILRFKL